jgi:hypothetical protein
LPYPYDDDDLEVELGEYAAEEVVYELLESHEPP